MARIKTITQTIYKFSELSEQAKDKIRYSQEYFWGDDVVKTLEEALKHFNYQLRNYSLDWDCFGRCSFTIESKNLNDVEELEGVRLWKYLQNFLDYYCKYDKKRKPLLEGNCPFTGVCFDEDFLDPIREFIKKPYSITFNDLMEECCNGVILTGCKDYEYQQSDEALEEHFEANDTEFDEDGNIA